MAVPVRTSHMAVPGCTWHMVDGCTWSRKTRIHQPDMEDNILAHPLLSYLATWLSKSIQTQEKQTLENAFIANRCFHFGLSQCFKFKSFLLTHFSKALNMTGGGVQGVPGARFSEPMEVVFPSGDYCCMFLSTWGICSTCL